MKLWKAGSKKGFVEQNHRIHVCTLSWTSIGIHRFMHSLRAQWLSGKESACSAGVERDACSIPGSGRSPGGGHGNPLQYSYLEHPMDRGAWWGTVHRVTKSRTWLKQLSMHHRHRIWHEKYSTVEKSVLWTLMHSFSALKKKLRKHPAYTEGWICKDT